MDVTINRKRAERVFGRLLEAYRNNEYPYNDVKLPQRPKNLPNDLEYGSYEHACYLFYSCNYMRGPIDSNFAFDQLAETWKVDAGIFDPGVLITTTDLAAAQRRVHDALIESELYYNAEAISKYWVFNAYKLYRYWNCDPRLIFAESEDFVVLKSYLIADDEAKNSLVAPWGF